jgi:hypothetical protein
MWRVLAVAAVLYGFGHRDLDAYRPVAFDRSLREFHRDVNRMTATATQAFVMFDQKRSLQSLSTMAAQLQAMLSRN